MPVRMELTLSNLEPTIAQAMVFEVSESQKMANLVESTDMEVG